MQFILKLKLLTTFKRIYENVGTYILVLTFTTTYSWKKIINIRNFHDK